MKNKKKYYFVSYTATIKSSSSGYSVGNASLSSESCYLNQKETVKLIKELNQNLDSVTITNIIEITKGQYECWIS